MAKKKDSAIDYYRAGNTFIELEHFHEAMECFGAAIDLDARFFDAYLNRGCLRNKTGNTLGALDDFRIAVEIDPTSPVAHNNLGTSYEACSRLPEALDEYNKAIDLESEYFEAYVNRSNTYLKLNEREKALNDINTAISLRKDHPEAYNARARVWSAYNEPQKALVDFEHAIALKPSAAHPSVAVGAETALAYRGKANALQALGRDKEAIKVRTDAVEADLPGWIETQDVLDKYKATIQNIPQKNQQRSDAEVPTDWPTQVRQGTPRNVFSLGPKVRTTSNDKRKRSMS